MDEARAAENPSQTTLRISDVLPMQPVEYTCENLRSLREEGEYLRANLAGISNVIDTCWRRPR